MILTTPHVIITVVRVHKRPLLWYLIGEDWYSIQLSSSPVRRILRDCHYTGPK